MRLLFITLPLLCIGSESAESLHRHHTRQWAIQAASEGTSLEFAVTHGFIHIGHILDDYYLLETTVHDVPFYVESIIQGSWNNTPVHNLLKRSSLQVEEILAKHTSWFNLQIPKRRYKRTELQARNSDITMFSDPLYPKQWHLYNNGDNGLYPDNDIHVLPLWKRGINGSGIVVSVIDDGVDFLHPDLVDSWSQESSFDFVTRNNKPFPQNPEDTHGTRCAGEIAAKPNNDGNANINPLLVCGVGVAFGAKLAAERLIAESTIDAVEAQAFTFKNQINDIYSASWGPSDDGRSLDGPGQFGSKALLDGVTVGRRGYGSIFVFASGNGGKERDNCNFDGYANSIHTVSIGAITCSGRMPWYGEECSAHLGVVFSGGEGLSISTTDLNGACTSKHSGTSAAAPLASGIIALMLSVRPDLSWRDVQQLIVETAQQTDPKDADWSKNGAGRFINHRYGFGKLDATLLVDAAIKHTTLPQLALKFSSSVYPNTKMVNNDGVNGFKSTIDIFSNDVGLMGLVSLEHVQVTVNIRHQERGHLQITLTSPMGTSSIIAGLRPNDESPNGYAPWTFMTVRNWGEKPDGQWILSVQDMRLGHEDAAGVKFEPGTLVSWDLVLHGTCASGDIIETISDSTGRKFKKCSHTVSTSERMQREIMIGAICFMVGIIFGVAVYILRKITSGSNSSSGKNFRYSKAFLDQNDDLESPTLTGHQQTSQDPIILRNFNSYPQAKQQQKFGDQSKDANSDSGSEYSSDEDEKSTRQSFNIESSKSLVKKLVDALPTALAKSRSAVGLLFNDDQTSFTRNPSLPATLRRTNSAAKPLNAFEKNKGNDVSINMQRSASGLRLSTAAGESEKRLDKMALGFVDKKLDKNKSEKSLLAGVLGEVQKATMTRSKSSFIAQKNA